MNDSDFQFTNGQQRMAQSVRLRLQLTLVEIERGGREPGERIRNVIEWLREVEKQQKPVIKQSVFTFPFLIFSLILLSSGLVTYFYMNSKLPFKPNHEYRMEQDGSIRELKHHQNMKYENSTNTTRKPLPDR